MWLCVPRDMHGVCGAATKVGYVFFPTCCSSAALCMHGQMERHCIQCPPPTRFTIDVCCSQSSASSLWQAS
jgi:hypothetical protein